MRYRRIIDGEPQFGQGRQDFLEEIDAVAQAIATRLRLFTNEWWEDQNDGLPMWTQLLGYNGSNKTRVNTIITKRILDTKLDTTKLILRMTNIASIWDGTLRRYTYTGTAISVYGAITISSGG